MAQQLEGPWHTDKWFVSPWNYQEEARAGFNFAPKIRFHDVTLRDGEQQAGIEFTKDEKVRIAEKLAESGVQRIEAGMPVVSASDQEAVKAIAKMNLGDTEVFAFSRCMVDDVKRAVDAGVKGVVVEIPSSEHIIKHAYKWELEQSIDYSIKATRYAKEQGLYVVWFPIDASRAEMTWLLKLVKRVMTDGHMDALALVDTFGVLNPQACAYFTRTFKKQINKPLETHFHMDFGLGVANTIAALTEGAEVIHTSVSGIGERSGNTPMEDVAMALLTMYGVDPGLKTERFTALSQLVREYARIQAQPNRQIVGDSLFAIESGIVASWFKNCGDEHLLEVFPFRPELVGQQPGRVVLGKTSGIDSIALWLDKVGVEASEAEQLELVQAVKAKSLEKKGLLTEEEFRKLVDQTVKTPAVAR